jgi:ATP-dependent helicase/nuclease subunit A
MEPGQKPSSDLYRPVLWWTNPDAEKNFEAEAAVHRVQELTAEGIEPSEICLLMSTHLMMDQVAKVLNDSGVPYHRVSGMSFYTHREIQDASALLRFCLNPHDNVNLVGLLRSPYFEMTDDELVQLSGLNRESLWLTLLKDASAQLDVVRLLEYWKSSQVIGVSNAWEMMLIELGFFDESHNIDPSGEREARLWQFVTMVKGQEGAPGFSYLSFLTKLEEGDEEFQQSLSEMPPARVSDRVQMMTVHASKGLEFDHVILPFLGRRPRPGRTSPLLLNEDSRQWSWSILDPEGGRSHPRLTEQWTDIRRQQEAEEKDRLLYVAMTRAKVGLSLICGEVEKSSWAERFPVLNSENYSSFVDVREGAAESARLTREERTRLPPRKLWNALGESAGIIRTASMSVTQLLPTHDAGAPPPMTLIEASLKGNEIHRELESWKYLPVDQWAKSEWYSLLKDFRAGLVLEVMRTGEVESGFIATLEGRIFQGKIDLWGRDANGEAWIIDYKSGSAQSYEKSFLQLEYYSLALKLMGKVGPDEPVHCLPLYLFDLGASRAGPARAYDVLVAEVRARLSDL